jgi:hypothetical protein
MAYDTVQELYRAVLSRLREPGYAATYADESAFEADVWARLVELPGLDAAQHCLTSHTQREGRSASAFKAFFKETRGPDVRVLGSSNRLDIVVKHHVKGSVGIEVKCLGKGGHTGKLTQGLGQAMLALENRDRTLLMIHCGTVSPDARRRLQRVADNICRGTRTAVIVVPR